LCNNVFNVAASVSVVDEDDLVTAALGSTERIGEGDRSPMPYSDGGTKKFFAYVMKNMKIMGAQNARTLVKNQWRTKTTSSVFLVRIHVWLRIAPAMMAS
jgi:hypothetical protein